MRSHAWHGRRDTELPSPLNRGAAGTPKTAGGDAGRSLLRRVRRVFAPLGDPRRAAATQAYMKSALPYHGVRGPDVWRLCRETLKDVDFGSSEELRDAVLGMWRAAKYREELYAVYALTGLRRCERFQTAAALPLYEELILTGAWWDLVDGLAVHRLRRLLVNEPAAVAPVLRAWSRCDQLWKRRAAILAQVLRREETDTALLFDCIAPSLEGSDVPRPSDEAATPKRQFWLRKAIGWALRDLARHRPEVVRRYLKAQGPKLSGLSRREAEKGLARPAKRRSARSKRT